MNMYEIICHWKRSLSELSGGVGIISIGVGVLLPGKFSVVDGSIVIVFELGGVHLKMKIERSPSGKRLCVFFKYAISYSVVRAGFDIVLNGGSMGFHVDNVVI